MKLPFTIACFCAESECSLLAIQRISVAGHALQGKQTRAQFSNWLCYEAFKACTKKPPPMPKDRKPGPAFEVADPQEAQLAKMMDSMKVRLAKVPYISHHISLQDPTKLPALLLVGCTY